MTDASDMRHCAEAIRTGSHSFHAASKLLPSRVRDPALALYAFCRVADDEVDLDSGKAAAVAALRHRLDLIYRGTPANRPSDRAFAGVVEDFAMPRALPEALLEGLAWDAEARRYHTLSDLRAYSARVASAVGAMMCVLMGVRDADVLARACDLGVAMQLTNIARDVGEDARAGRLYLPDTWLADEGIDREAFLAAPRMSPALADVVQRLLREADALYARSEAGIGALPLSCRPGIFAARFIYAGIGGRLRQRGCNSVDHRARTNSAEKLGWLGLSTIRAGASIVMPRSPMIFARPLAETAFLVDAAAIRPEDGAHWSEPLFETLSGLKARDADARAALVSARVGAR